MLLLCAPTPTRDARATCQTGAQQEKAGTRRRVPATKLVVCGRDAGVRAARRPAGAGIGSHHVVFLMDDLDFHGGVFLLGLLCGLV